MNSSEYIQLIRNSFIVSEKGITLEKIDNALFYIDEVRKRHNKYQNNLEYLLSDPQSYENKQEKEKIIGIYKDIKEACVNGKIESRFIKLPEQWEDFNKNFKSRIFVSYYFEGIEITELIVLRKNKPEEGKIEMIEELKLGELNFLEEPSADGQAEGDSFITDESNKLPGDV